MLESKHQNRVDTPGFTFCQKFKAYPSAGKLLLTIVWDSQGHVHTGHPSKIL
jgi:hypothetical protein